ncbi:MAG: hypothetical protein NT138_08380 [Planctomycetales bacterium]|nr:hypothetical protein [Planctomycetales bacterium]
MVSSSRQILFLVTGLALMLPAQVGHGQELFPLTPYSGMQLSYTLTGVEVTDFSESEEVTLVRTLEGESFGEEIRIHGEFLCRSPEKTEFRVELWVDDEKRETRFPSDDETLQLTSPQTFDLKIPVLRGAKKAGFTIIATTKTIVGPSVFSLLGQFTVADSTPAQDLRSSSSVRVAVGEVTEQLSGEVQTRTDDGAGWRMLVAGDSLFVGSKIRTESDSTVMVKITRDDQLFVDQNSEVIFQENGVLLVRGGLKLSCSPEQSVRLIWTADYITEFIGQHLGLDYVDSRTTVSNIDGTATITLQAHSTKGVEIQSAVRAEGDEQGLDRFETIDLAEVDSKWQQLGLDNITTPTIETIATREPESDETSEIAMTAPAVELLRDTGEVDAEPIPIEIPSDPNARIIMLDFAGGYTPKRTSNEPELVIYADGRAVITDPFGKLPKLTKRLSADNVKEFLEFLVNKHHFYDLSTQGLADLIEQKKAEGGVPEITDMPTAIIRIGIQNKTYEVRCLSPDYFASQFPEVEPFQDYAAIHKRLTTFITATRAWAAKQKR